MTFVRPQRSLQRGLLDDWFIRHPELAKFVLHRLGRPVVTSEVLDLVSIGCREESLKQACCVKKCDQRPGPGIGFSAGSL